MAKTKSNAYLETKVMTASPEQLQLMLYDGAIRFCEQAREAIGAKEIEKGFTLISKAETIVMELSNSMRDDIAPETCANMRRLYLFCYDRLVQANLKRNAEPLQEAIVVLHELRETWLLLMEKLNDEREGTEQGKPQDDAVAEQMGATISFEG